MFPWSPRLHIGEHAAILPPEVRYFLRIKSKYDEKKRSFFQENPQDVSLQTWNAVLTTMLISPRKNSHSCLPKVWRRQIQYVFFRKKFLETFIWTRVMQCWKPCWLLFAENSKIFRPKYEIDEKFCPFHNLFSLKLFPWTRRLHF